VVLISLAVVVHGRHRHSKSHATHVKHHQSRHHNHGQLEEEALSVNMEAGQPEMWIKSLKHRRDRISKWEQTTYFDCVVAYLDTSGQQREFKIEFSREFPDDPAVVDLEQKESDVMERMTIRNWKWMIPGATVACSETFSISLKERGSGQVYSFIGCPTNTNVDNKVLKLRENLPAKYSPAQESKMQAVRAEIDSLERKSRASTDSDAYITQSAALRSLTDLDIIGLISAGKATGGWIPDFSMWIRERHVEKKTYLPPGYDPDAHMVLRSKTYTMRYELLISSADKTSAGELTVKFEAQKDAPTKDVPTISAVAPVFSSSNMPISVSEVRFTGNPMGHPSTTTFVTPSGNLFFSKRTVVEYVPTELAKLENTKKDPSKEAAQNIVLAELREKYDEAHALRQSFSPEHNAALEKIEELRKETRVSNNAHLGELATCGAFLPDSAACHACYPSEAAKGCPGIVPADFTCAPGKLEGGVDACLPYHMCTGHIDVLPIASCYASCCEQP